MYCTYIVILYVALYSAGPGIQSLEECLMYREPLRTAYLTNAVTSNHF